MQRLLIANRGEIAVRIAQSAADLGITTIALASEDEAHAWHVSQCDESVTLAETGPRAYLNIDAVIGAARKMNCDAIHPGYGFLSESAAFALACAAAGLTFIGPNPQALAAFGNKAAARTMAAEAGIPVLRGTNGPTSLGEAQGFLAALQSTSELSSNIGPATRDNQAGSGDPAVMIKAIAGGGGRGMRIARNSAELERAFTACTRQAVAAFGNGQLYVEEFLPKARHVEVQIVGDGHEVLHLWDRECSLQRHRQKLVEVAPAFMIDEEIRQQLFEYAVTLGQLTSYNSLGTIEFLVAEQTAIYIESNPRLQVEHTVTEEVTGLDLVALQLQIAQGKTLAELGLSSAAISPPKGIAIQVRINAETMETNGSVAPAVGTLHEFEPPTGRGIRMDTGFRSGHHTNPRFDSLLAKLIVTSPGTWSTALAKTRGALDQTNIEGVETNQSFLLELLARPEVEAAKFHTTFIDEHLDELLDSSNETVGVEASPSLNKALLASPAQQINTSTSISTDAATPKNQKQPASATTSAPPNGNHTITAHTDGTVVEVLVKSGDTVNHGDELLIIEAMKMEHLVLADSAGVATQVLTQVGDTVAKGQPIIILEPANLVANNAPQETEIFDLDEIRPDLGEVLDRRRYTLDANRPEAVKRRHAKGHRTVRENLDDLCDSGTFTEWGAFTVAARRRRNSIEELITQTPADGFVMGTAHVNGHLFSVEQSRIAVMGYDYTVLAGTQGANNHFKLDRIAELALRWRLPTVIFAEGGGGRPGDTEGGGFIRGFEYWGKLSGAVPLVGIVSGNCFAGNAALLGCCDVIIATKSTSLGMGGPAMVEGGGLGTFRPEEIGPIEVMQQNGVIDVLVEDEAEAVAIAKQYLSYFQGSTENWECADQRLLRRAIPENRVRAYDIRSLIETMADTDSVLELRPNFGLAMITAFARIEGHPVGVMANNPMHLGGAIDSDAADKAARFMQLCEAYDIPIVSLSDTPGNMVGPEAETTGLIRHCSRMFVIGANLSVPLLAVILRKSYGLGAIAMTGGSYQASMFTISWPTGEFGGMGLEGAVQLGYRNELAAIENPDERQATYESMVAAAYERGKALAQGLTPALDDVIDPADTRRWISNALAALPPRPVRTDKKLPWIDAW